MAETTAAATWDTKSLQVMSYVWVIIAAVIVTARLLTRIYLVKAQGFDDYLIVIALLASIGVTITMEAQINYGMGTAFPEAGKVAVSFWASVWTYSLSITFTKLSVVVSYLRIFPHELFRKLCWTYIGLFIVLSLWNLFSSIVICVPIEKSWATITNDESGCLDRAIAWIFNACSNMISDLILIILPMPVLKNLNMPIRQRIALMFVFAIGGFVCVMSAIRLVFLIGFLKTLSINNDIALWSVTEINVGIICACLPSLKALIVRAWPRFAGYSHRYKYRTKGCSSCDRAGCTNGTIVAADTSNRDQKSLQSSSLALSPSIKSPSIFNWNPPRKTTTSNIQGGVNHSFDCHSHHKDSAKVSQRGLGLSMPNQASLSQTMSNGGEPGIAVTTILEQEIEMMELDGGSDTASQSRLFCSNSLHKEQDEVHRDQDSTTKD